MGKLQLKSVSKHFKQKKKKDITAFSIDSTSLTLEQGEFFSLLGPSGCGKTTLLKLVSGLMTPDSGEIDIDGKSQMKVPPEKREISMVFQQPLLFPHMTVEENVAFGLKMKGQSKEKRLKQANEMLSSMGLDGFGKRNPGELSGGQQQRVALARAFVMQSKLMLMDEPFSALDPELREEMRELLLKLHKEFESTILFVTHDREEAFQLSNRIAVMSNGAILQVGTPESLYQAPKDKFVASFLGAKNAVYGTLKQGQFTSEHFYLSLPQKDYLDQMGWLIIRPEVIEISRHEKSNLKGKILDVTFNQGFYHSVVDVGGIQLKVVEKGSTTRPEIGEAVFLHFDSTSLIFIPE